MNNIDDESLEQAKKLANLLGKFIKQALKPYLPVIAIGFGIFFLLVMLIAGVYSAFPSTWSLTGIAPTAEDEKVKDDYEQLCDKYNVKDTWIVNKKPVSPEDGNAYESSPKNPYYPGKGVSLLGKMGDRYGHDGVLALRWGTAHAATLYETYTLNLKKIDKELQEKVINGLHPYFYYKMSYVIIGTTDEDGQVSVEKIPVPLLVEAYTNQGHFQFHYKWVSKTIGAGSSSVTITEEEFVSSQQILPNKWQRLEDWMVNEYKLSKDDKSISLAREAIWEAGNGYNKHSEWLNWLLLNGLYYNYVTGATIPPELISLFKEAEAKYGIPWWFSAAVSFKESSFRIDADNRENFPNASVHCYGLMQLTDENWERISRQLGFDPVLDRDNPRAQIFCGVYMLKNLFGDIDWNGDWRGATLSGLAFYGGFRGDNALERCKNEYASVIWGIADNFKNATPWPVPGYYHITSHFGDTEGRDHVHQGIDIACPVGISVVSTSAGKVIYAGWQNPADTTEGFGMYVCVEDNLHMYYYGHLSQITVSAGQDVNQGDTVGFSGNTGSSTGPHLHFQINNLTANGDKGQAIDPLTVLIVPEQ
ncbi:MAG: Murein DD-endopeptidase MepM [Pelotomaculum sp. PtaB.Bin104]|nr:MAG: Murein DD-endopeptidase MepM [Pelotomaculum sp. PtaB.Bin104]OPY60711.1 MAG: Murein DD-endopeptidase MepM [Pelotomaculum sp. PtaU1.Bin065]